MSPVRVWVAEAQPWAGDKRRTGAGLAQGSAVGDLFPLGLSNECGAVR